MAHELPPFDRKQRTIALLSPTTFGAKRTFSAIGTSCDQSRDHDVRPTSEALRSTSSNTTLNWRDPLRPAKLIYRRTASVRSRHRSDLSISAARTRSVSPTHCGAHHGFMASFSSSASMSDKPPLQSIWRGEGDRRPKDGRHSFIITATASRRWTCSWFRQSHSDCSTGC